MQTQARNYLLYFYMPVAVIFQTKLEKASSNISLERRGLIIIKPHIEENNRTKTCLFVKETFSESKIDTFLIRLFVVLAFSLINIFKTLNF